MQQMKKSDPSIDFLSEPKPTQEERASNEESQAPAPISNQAECAEFAETTDTAESAVFPQKARTPGTPAAVTPARPAQAAKEAEPIPIWLPPSALAVKSAFLHERVRSCGAVGLETASYELDKKTEDRLGSGTFGHVHAAVHRRKGREMVAIKLFHAGHTRASDKEVRLNCSVPPHPHIVRLVDVAYFAEPAWCIGLVFELFETDLSVVLEKSPLTTTAQKHI